MRIVSLLPSATEIICALGLESRLVGVTHECDYPPVVMNKPKVTHTLIPTDASSATIDGLVRARRRDGTALYALDFKRMAELAPDLIVSQTLCDVCAVDDAEVRRFVDAFESVRGPSRSRARVIYLEPTRLADVLDNIREVADAAGASLAGEALVAELSARIESVRVSAATRSDRPRVVVLEWLDPLFSCGHWTPELVQIAGGVEPLARAGERSRRIDVSELVAADPDMILIACCGLSIERTKQDIPTFLAQPAVATLRCVREGRVFIVDGSAYFSRPGPRLMDSLEILAHALDPRRHPLRTGLPPAPRWTGRMS